MIGRPRVHHAVTGSTNERAKELAATGAPHGTLVTADEQSAGRGRQGRTWVAPRRSAVLMSLVLREYDALLPLRAAVAAREGLACGANMMHEPSIKWPNDLWVDGRKLGGILVEGRPQEGWAVLGMGLNVWTESEDFPPDLREIATSVVMVEGGAPDVEVVLGELLPYLDIWLRAKPAEVLEAWRAWDALKGRAISWDGGSGTAAGIDDSGALLVDTTDGRVALQAGEVHLRLE